MRQIIIEVDRYSWPATIFDTPTGQKIIEALPLESTVNVWGNEMYFSTGLNIELEEEAKEEVEIGDLAFWPVDDAFCIFFGPTPLSSGDKPVAYSPVNVFGQVSSDPELFKNIEPGSIVRISLENV